MRKAWNRIDLNEDTLRKLYLKDKLTQNEIANRLKTTREVVASNLDRYHICIPKKEMIRRIKLKQSITSRNHWKSPIYRKDITNKISNGWTKERRMKQQVLWRKLVKKWIREGRLKLKGRHHPRWVEKIAIPCKFCKNEIKVTRHESKNKRFCSKRCYSKWQKINQKGKRNVFFGRHHNEYSKKLIGIKHLRENISEETIEKIRKARMKQKFPIENTSIETFLFATLKLLNIKYRRHKTLFKRFQPDAFIFPNKCIYADGDYWHGNPKFYKTLDHIQRSNRNRDADANFYLKKNDYKVLRLWENNIEKQPSRCIERIEKFLKIE